MAACKLCAALMGKATSVEPHEALVMDNLEFHATGELHRLRCRLCQTKWERFTPNDSHSGQPTVWKLLGSPGSRPVAV
jgi:hypothetical protein